MIGVLSQEASVRQLCELVGCARSSYYYRPVEVDEAEIRGQIEAICLEFPRYGYRRVTRQLHRRGHRVNHKRVHRMMQEANLLVEVRRLCGSTTDSHHPWGRYPNLVKGLVIDHPDQVWCADITYIRLRKEYVYLAVLMDVFTRAVRGWYLSRQLTEQLAHAALMRALAVHRAPEIHHSDQGVQYACGGYTDLLQQAGVQVSMAAVGRPTQNAYAERLIRTLKDEEVYLHEYETFAEAQDRIGHFLEDVYMHKRIHSSLGYLTPAEFEAGYLLDGARKVGSEA